MTKAQLLRRLVLMLLPCVWMLGSSANVMAGCDFGHGGQLRVSNDASGYARNFRVLGQWVYERGEIRYVAWQASHECHGPECSARKEAPQETSGLSLPQSERAPTTVALLVSQAYSNIPDSGEVLQLRDAQALYGYPPAYEYPP